MTRSNAHRLRLLRGAEAELEERVLRLAGRDQEAARQFLNRLGQEMEILLENPELGLFPEELGLAQAGFRSLRFEGVEIFYRVLEGTLYLHHIR